MTNRFVKGTLLATAGLVLGLAGVAWAQRGPGGPGGPGGGPGGPPPMMHMRGPQQVMLAGETGLYVQTGPTLVKYDARTLQQLGEVQLLELPEAPAQEGMQGGRPPMPPPPLALQLADDGRDTLVAVAGDTVYNIDGRTMTIVTRTALPELQLPAPGPDGMPPQGGPGGRQPQGGPGMRQQQQGGPGMGGPQGGPGGRMMPPPPPIAIEVKGNTAYILRANQLVAVDIAQGAITGQTELPIGPRGPRGQGR